MTKEQVILDANAVVAKYAEKKTREAITRVESLRTHTHACGCINCARQAVDDINRWADWHAEANPDLKKYSDMLHYKIKPRKKGWDIVMGK